MDYTKNGLLTLFRMDLFRVHLTFIESLKVDFNLVAILMWALLKIKVFE